MACVSLVAGGSASSSVRVVAQRLMAGSPSPARCSLLKQRAVGCVDSAAVVAAWAWQARRLAAGQWSAVSASIWYGYQVVWQSWVQIAAAVGVCLAGGRGGSALVALPLLSFVALIVGVVASGLAVALRRLSSSSLAL